MEHEMLIRDLTRDLLNQLFWYDEVIGQLRWKMRPSKCVKVNDLAGYIDNGYRCVVVSGKKYMAHRMIWTMVVGCAPEGYQIDHIDGDRSNNHISNLRLATHGENQHNSRTPSNNTSGMKGVDFRKKSGKWRVRIAKDGKRTESLFATKGEAESFVRKTRELLHEDFCNHG
jgi:hypothetical protein